MLMTPVMHLRPLRRTIIFDDDDDDDVGVIRGPCLLWPNGHPSQLLLSSCTKGRPKFD